MPDSVLHPFYDVRACADAVTFGDVFSVCAGFASCFVGVVELLFGFKCNSDGDSDDGGSQGGQGGGGGRHTVEPTLSVNITPSQVCASPALAQRACVTRTRPLSRMRPCPRVCVRDGNRRPAQQTGRRTMPEQSPRWRAWQHRQTPAAAVAAAPTIPSSATLT